MRFAVIENGTVTNLVEADSALSNTWVADAGSAWIGASWNGATFSAPPAPSAAEFNAPILAQLAAIDAKSIRALRENDQTRIAAWEAQAAALRAQLQKT